MPEMEQKPIRYYFLPYFRSGVAAAISQHPASGETRASLNVELTIEAQKLDGQKETMEPIIREIQLYGPGDVTGFSQEVIASHSPRPHVGDFEPNYFPTLEFREPDFPWRFTPDAPNGNRLTPWLTLVVLKAGNGSGTEAEFTEPESTAVQRNAEKKRLPYIENVSPQNSLPDLHEAWRWAHVQVTSGEVLTIADLKTLIGSVPERVSSRLLCARRLHPGTLYHAFLVPTFKLGVLAGGIPGSSEGVTATDLAWDASSDEKIRLPYYYRWEFRTGQRGDFERLVRQLEPRSLDAVGKRVMDCVNAGYGLSVDHTDAAGEEHLLEVEGALQAGDMQPTAWGCDRAPDPSATPDEFRSRLAGLLNRNSKAAGGISVAIPNVAGVIEILGGKLVVGADHADVYWQTNVHCEGKVQYGMDTLDHEVRSEQGKWSLSHHLRIDGLVRGKRYQVRVECLSQDGQQGVSETVRIVARPLLLPPIYGYWHAKRESVSAEVAAGNWLDELNLDPRHRAAAGIGAAVVRKNQEDLMASAWDQIGDAEKANNILNHGLLGKEVSGKIHRRFKALDPKEMLLVTRQLHPRVAGAFDKASAYQVLKESRVPSAVFDHAFRRMRRSNGPVRKRQMKAKASIALVPQGQLMERFNGQLDASKKLFRVASDRAEPAGVINMAQTMQTFTEKAVSTLAVPLSAHTAGAAPVKKAFGISVGEVDAKKKSLRGTDKTVDKKVAGAFSAMLGKVLVSDKVRKEIPEYLSLAEVHRNLSNEILPDATILKRLGCRIPSIKGQIEEGRIPDRITGTPKFPQAMYRSLLEISKEWLIPGIEKIQGNSVAILKTNGRFVESFLCGCNHEFASELVWREYPSVNAGSFFRSFWRDNVAEVPLLDEWKARRLGKNSGKQNEPWVLLVRGELLKRYPNAVLYLVPRMTDRKGNVKPALPEYWPEGTVLKVPRHPIFSARIPEDIAVFGFDITSDIKDYYVVIEERISEARFGLDEASEAVSSAVDKWDDLSWGYFGETLLDGDSYMNGAAPKGAGGLSPKWNNSNSTTAAGIAAITLQKPVRIVMPAFALT